MSTFDQNSPAQSHGALSDIDVIRNNTIALRDHESSVAASPPSNPVAGGDWHASDTESRYVRTNAGGWLYLWSVSDPPAKSSDLTTHTGANITNIVTVHGIRQGAGNGLDADLLDGNHSSAFLGASHGTATSGIHGVSAGLIVGTTLTQTLTNKTLTSPVIGGGSITSNVTVGGAYVDGRDPSVDGAKLDTYPGGGLATPSNGSVTQVKIASASVGQAQLKTTTGAVSTTNASFTNLTLPGGTYGFYPQIKKSAGSSYITVISLIVAVSSPAHNATIDYGPNASGTIYAQQRYIQASPPYKIGDTVWGHFLFLLRKITTGEVVSAYEAEDPPWAYNGKVWLPKDHADRISEVPHPFADYIERDPAVDGLEIVLVNLNAVDTKKWREDNWKVGKSTLEDIPAVLPGKGIQKAFADFSVPAIARFTDKVKVIAP